MYSENQNKKMSVKKNTAQIGTGNKVPCDKEPDKQEWLDANFYGKRI